MSTTTTTERETTVNGTDSGVRHALWEKAAELVFNQIYSRIDFLKQPGDPRRNLDDECGYPSERGPVNIEEYQILFERDGIANRYVSFGPDECWQVSPNIYESEDTEELTPFEQDWATVTKTLRGENCYYLDEEGSPVWEYMHRVDVQSGIGHYGVLLLGFDDVKGGRSLADPVEGFEEVNSVPSDEPDKPAGTDAQYYQHYGSYSLNVNAEKTKGRKLLFLRVFPESLAQVTRRETNPTSPRYGMPLSYNLTLDDPRIQTLGTASYGNINVHWSRVIHIAENLTSSESYAAPRLRPVLNNILNIRKISGASGEGYYKSCFTGLSFETVPQLGGNVKVDKAELRQMYEEFVNGLQRAFFLRGMQVKTIAPAVVDPSPHIDKQIEMICICGGYPVRIFKGSERGELASSQDERAHSHRMKRRQVIYITARIIVPFVDRLIQVGVLRKPGIQKNGSNDNGTVKPGRVSIGGVPYTERTRTGKSVSPSIQSGYSVDWPDIDTGTDKEKAEVASIIINALAAYVQGGVETVFPPRQVLTLIFKLKDEEVDHVLDAARKVAEGDDTDAGGSPLLGLVGGITSMIELYKGAKDGALSEEQLKAVIKLFYKVDDDTVEELIADGLTPTATEAGSGMEAEIEADRMKIDEGLKQDPLEKEPPMPIKVKEGEKLVNPDGNPFAQ